MTDSFTDNVLQLNLQYGFFATQDANLGFDLSSTWAASPTSTARPADPDGQRLGRLRAGRQPQPAVDAGVLSPGQQQDQRQRTGRRLGHRVQGHGRAAGAHHRQRHRADRRRHPGHAATWTVGLKTSSTNHLWPLPSAAAEITSAIKGQVNIVLPTFFPTPDQPLDPTTPNIELHVTNLASPLRRRP